jgi:hypothetical protein
MIQLPNGFMLKHKQVGKIVGSEFELIVYWRRTPQDFSRPAFELRKHYNINLAQYKYAGRLVNAYEVGGGDWLQDTDLDRLILTMCAKARILGGGHGSK